MAESEIKVSPIEEAVEKHWVVRFLLAPISERVFKKEQKRIRLELEERYPGLRWWRELSSAGKVR